MRMIVLLVGVLVLLQTPTSRLQVPGPVQNPRIEGETMMVMNETNCTIRLEAGAQTGPWQRADVPIDANKVPISIFRQPMLRISTLCR